VTLRRATEADVDDMVEVQLAAWREAFVPILPPSFRVPEAEEFAPRLADSLRGGGVHSTLALDSGAEHVLGWITHGANRDIDAGPDVGEVRAVFVSPGAWGSGVGGALLTHALEGLKEDGYGEATLWSFADNDRANTFYERHGFARDGAEQRRDFSAGALEVRYRRSL
jgi:GNAT superfamily N-acetyltransferase